MINISDQDIVSLALTDNKGDITNNHMEHHVLTIPDQDTASSNQFLALTNKKDGISVKRIR